MQLELNATPVFEKIQDSLAKKIIKILVLRWGTRSSKTYSALETLLIWLLTGKIAERYREEWVCHIVRKYKNTVRISVMRDFEDLIDQYELRAYVEINTTNKTYKIGWRMVEFIGADDQQKLRWSKRDILYCNEANELDYKSEFFQLLIRTKDIVIIDFNPDDEDIRINTEIEQKRRSIKKDVDVIVSTYKDNPFLTDWEISEIENIKNIDPYLWQVYGKWEYWKRQWLIFQNFEIIEELPKEAKYLAHGLDFWFSNDPTALTGIYQWNWWIVLDEEIYKTGLTNADISKEMENREMKRLDCEIIADSSEPKSIEELNRLQWNVKPAVKWPDSIVFWIQVMLNYKIYITARSLNVIKEYRKYKWIEDRTWNATNKPIDEFNHAIDWIRYAMSLKLWSPEKTPQLYI